MRFAPLIALVVAAIVPLTACGPGGNADNAPEPETSPPSASPTTTAPMHAYRDARWHFGIDVPPGWALHHDFTVAYLANGAWKTYADLQSQGTPVLALVVPGSNRITDAEIRIGASHAAVEVQRCTTPPDTAHPGSLTDKEIDGVGFMAFTASDAAMSHHLDVHSYRTVHDGVCYAIDLLVYGVDPQVFDPPATPPFSREQAFTRMRSVLASFRFMH